MFALLRLREATTVPVVGEMVRVPSAFDTDDTAPPPPPTHVPLTAKQPAVMLKPLAEVVVAAPVISSLRSVVLPVVLLSVRNGTLVVANVVGDDVEI